MKDHLEQPIKITKKKEKDKRNRRDGIHGEEQALLL